jgi:PAS domain S-box-containing protein
MSSVAYEKWFGAVAGPVPHAAFRALQASRLDSFLADSQDDGVMVIDHNGCIIDGNLALSRRTGFGRGEIIGRPMVDVVLPAHRRRIQAAIDDALRGDGVRARALGVKRSGGTCDLAITFVPLFDEQRTVVGSLVITQNLSEAAEAARERERDGALLSMAGRIAGFIGWRLDLPSRTLDWSGDLAGFGGRPPTTLDGLLELTDHADAARLARALERSEREQRQLDVTLAVSVTQGERHLRLIGEPLRTRAGEPGVISGAAHDVTEWVDEQRQRREVEELLSITVNAMTDGLGVVDDEWRFTFVNDRLVEMMGREREAIIGATVWQAAPELCGTEFEIAFRTAVADSTTVHVRDHIEAREAWIEAIAYPSGGGLAVHLRDVTETELAEQRYRRAQEELATLGGLLDISRDAIVVRDPQHRIRYANSGALALYGWDADSVVGADSRDLVTIDPAQSDEAMSTVLSEGLWSGRVAVRTADGRDIVVSSRWQLMRDEQGGADAVLSVSADITDDVAREEAIHRAERLESLGTFAGGIAHDLNNVLTPILMASQLLGVTLQGTSDHETAAMIETAARRGADMVRQVLAFARGVETRSESIVMTDLLDELRGMVSETLRSGVELTVSTPPEPVRFTGDATQLLQVLANLVSNAHDAIEGDGVITLDARIDDAADSGTRHVLIDVIDTGHGMSPDVIERLWEPFFTTKPVGKGTGLGLPMVAAIMRGHGGSVEVESDGATGSRFTLRLPLGRLTTPLERRDHRDVAATPRGDGERVLVVDDEQAIRTIVRQALEAEGYEVSVASSGDDAWRHIQSTAAPPALVLSDVTMAGISGIELVERLIDAGISIPVILMSGLEDRGSVDSIITQRVHGFLVKPLSSATLLLAVHDALTTTRSRKESS